MPRLGLQDRRRRPVYTVQGVFGDIQRIGSP